MRLLAAILRKFIDIRVLYALAGGVLSILVHELFHIILHLGHVQSIGLFSDPYSIVTITSDVPSGYNFIIEEIIAYAITAIILFITCIDVMAIHDSKNEKSVKKILFPHMNIDQKTILDLAHKAHIIK